VKCFESFVVDDHQLVRIGTRRLLEDTAVIKVIANARGGWESVGFIRELNPEVVLIGIQMSRVSGLKGAQCQHL
jgi:DNA-binding NarL/FixJ family response regulator